MVTRLILDTDIGTDVDDCLAIAVLLGSPEIELVGVTCVYGDVHLRARMVQKLLRLAGRDGIPVMVGAEQSLTGERDVYWAGHEGEGLLEEGDEGLTPDPEPAVDYLIRMAREQPGELHLLAIGPLTNIALALQQEPRLFDLYRSVTIMGGAQRGPGGLGLPYGEHNFVCDPEAAAVVFSAESAVPPTLIPLDVTTRVVIRRDDIARIRAVGTPFLDAVAEQVERYPRFASGGSTQLHDPLAAAAVIAPLLLDTVPLTVDIVTAGAVGEGASLMRLPREGNRATASVALAVDSGPTERFIIDLIAGPTTVAADGGDMAAVAYGGRPGPNPVPRG